MSYDVSNCTVKELKQIASDLNLPLPSKMKKSEMVQEVQGVLNRYNQYKKKIDQKYTKIKKLGEGKEGTTYLVEDQKGNKFAMKTFRNLKSPTRIIQEYNLQLKASRYGACPKPHEYNTVFNYILMDLMDKHLIRQGKIHKYQQEQIIDLFENLDKAKVFHGDVNLTNYMIKDKKVYLIDFGFAKPIDKKLVKKLSTDTPNMDLMLLGLVLRLKEREFDPSSYKYLLKHIPESVRKEYSLS